MYAGQKQKFLSDCCAFSTLSLHEQNRTSKERLLELDMDPSKSQELTHRFDLEPGSLWQAIWGFARQFICVTVGFVVSGGCGGRCGSRWHNWKSSMHPDPGTDRSGLRVHAQGQQWGV